MNEATQKTLDKIAEEFGEQCAAGLRPSVEEYANRYPDISEDIRELFPTLQLVATLLPEDDAESSEFQPTDGDLENITIADFRLIRELGRGGMGVVYEAEQLSLKRRVALKVLPMAFLLGSERRARFEREAKAAGRLHHTNIVPVFGIGNSEETVFLIMQLIPGVSLDKLISRLRRADRLDSMFVHATSDTTPNAVSDTTQTDELAADANLTSDTDFAAGMDEASDSRHRITIGSGYWRDVAGVGRQVAEAIQYANDQGVLHRDIKPGNLIVDVDNRTWVSDFGLAKILDSDELTNTGDVLGTVKYMAPERLAGEYSERSEVYSLGATLYELAALQPAFASQKQKILGRKLLREPAEPLRKLCPSIPNDLCTVIEKAMAVEPENRYPNAGEFAADLTRFLNDEPIKARTTGFVEHTIRWARRNPLLATMVTALATCLLVAAIVSTRAAHHFQQLNFELAKTNEDLELANLKATTEQNLGQQRETRLLFQRGREFAEQGKIAEGLLMMTDALRQCPEEMKDYGRVIRANISAWSALVPEILEINPNAFNRHRAIDHFKNDVTEFFLLADERVRKIDGETGEQIDAAFELDSFAFDCSVSHDGRLAAVTTRGNPNELLILNLEDMTPLPVQLSVEDHVLEMPYWHPNGRSLAVRCDNNQHFVVWEDIRSSEHTVHRVPGMDAELVKYYGEFMRDGDEGQVRNWQRKRTSPDGRLRLDHSYATTLLTEVETENLLRLSLPHAQNVKTTADGTQFQSTHFRIRNLNSASRLPPNTTGSMTVIGGSKYWNHFTAAFSHDGATAIVRDPHISFWTESERKVPRTAAQLINTRTGQPIGKPLQHPFDSVRAVAISRDGTIAVTGGYHFGRVGGAAYVWDATTGRRLAGPLMHDNYVSALDISPNGKLLAAGDYAGQVRIWNLQTGEQVGEPFEAGKIVFAVRFDSLGQRVAVGLVGELMTSDNLVVWDMTKSQSTRLPQPTGVDHTTWIPDTDRLISYNCNSMRLWDLSRPHEPITALDDIGEIFGSSVSGDGSLIALGTAVGSVYLIDATTGEVLPNTLGHGSTVYDVDLSHDGKTLAVACNDGGLRIWDLKTFEQVGPPLMQNSHLYRAKILPGSRAALSTSRDGTIRYWNIPQSNDTPIDELNRLVEIRTGKHVVNGIAMKMPADEWASMREQAIRDEIMLSQADSAVNSEGMPTLVPALLPSELHEARCRDAEQDQDWFGAYWHLTQMISDDQDKVPPTNWLLFARRARTWSERGEFEQAALDYETASSLLTRQTDGRQTEMLVNWYRHRVVACQRAENWQAAIWYLDRILLLDDDDGNAYASRAGAHLKLGNTEKHAADIKRALKLCDDPIFQELYQP